MRKFVHTLADWCIRHTGPKLSTPAILDLAGELELQVDLAPESEWPAIYDRGLKVSCALPDMGNGFKPYGPGFANPDQWDHVEKVISHTIEAAATRGIQYVLVFTGYKTPGIHRQQALRNCVNGFTRKVVKLAEQRHVTLVLEMLNTIHADEVMEGHPLYLGDSTEDVVQVINRVNSPSFKLAFDIYHVSVMGEDPVKVVQDYGTAIGYVHTAGRGNPTRCALDAEGQLINYPDAMAALAKFGYKGFVCHEFLYRDPGRYKNQLTKAVEICES